MPASTDKRTRTGFLQTNHFSEESMDEMLPLGVGRLESVPEFLKWIVPHDLRGPTDGRRPILAQFRRFAHPAGWFSLNGRIRPLRAEPKHATHEAPACQPGQLRRAWEMVECTRTIEISDIVDNERLTEGLGCGPKPFT